MEALMFLLDSIAMVAMVVLGLMDEKRVDGLRTSIFRYRSEPTAPATPAAGPQRGTVQRDPIR